MDNSYIHMYIKLHAQIHQNVSDLEVLKKKIKYQLTQSAQLKNKLINEQNTILLMLILVTYSYTSSFMQIQQTALDLERLKVILIIN